LAHYVRSFYTHLYTSEVNAPGTHEAREVCWASTPTRVSNETNKELTQELTLKEIQEAILAMSKDKAPGCDGISTKFFQEFMSEVFPTLLQAFSAMLRNGETSELINKGLIILIPKIGRSGQNWKLAPNHSAGQFIQDLGQNTGQAASDLPPEYNKAQPDWFCRGEVYSRQHLPGARSPGLGRGEQPRLSPLTPRL
jgi:hypothetical protein